ncbi:MAG TPA: ABC transporter permease [Verrucomicrobiae bacterium]|jgi:phospholipid/cholesterol/gamma-HCH transport system permease protein|nr:ABC transporter permease [Verrucomicrobiae bacterium]
MESGNVPGAPRLRLLLRAPLPESYTNYAGRRLVRFLATAQGVGAFALITLGVIVTKLRSAPEVTFPAIRRELARSGLQLLPLFLFMSVATGLVVIGQAVLWLGRVGANSLLLGPIVIYVVVREVGPLLTALLVLSRSGTANVIELGTARALGEVEALEAVGIDPVHYLVMPRVIGMALGVMSLTVYFIIGTLASGYLCAFLNNVPLRPGDYFGQLAANLTGLDFAILAIKSCGFGALIAVITCYHGLAQPLQLDEVSRATVRAVGQSIIACVLLDAVFMFIYLAT